MSILEMLWLMALFVSLAGFSAMFAYVVVCAVKGLNPLGFIKQRWFWWFVLSGVLVNGASNSLSGILDLLTSGP